MDLDWRCKELTGVTVTLFGHTVAISPNKLSEVLRRGQSSRPKKWRESLNGWRSRIMQPTSAAGYI
jgi:hypothetical protein